MNLTILNIRNKRWFVIGRATIDKKPCWHSTDSKISLTDAMNQFLTLALTNY